MARLAWHVLQTRAQNAEGKHMWKSRHRVFGITCSKRTVRFIKWEPWEHYSKSNTNVKIMDCKATWSIAEVFLSFQKERVQCMTKSRSRQRLCKVLCQVVWATIYLLFTVYRWSIWDGYSSVLRYSAVFFFPFRINTTRTFWNLLHKLIPRIRAYTIR